MDAIGLDYARPPASIPMYLAAFVVTGCGLYATGVCLEDPGFTNLVFTLAGVGFLVSYLSRRQNVASRTVEVPALILCGLVFLLAFLGNQPFLAPASVGDDRAKSLVVLLTWLMVFRSFTLVNDGALMFCCVPAIALLGLVNTITVTADVLVTDFLVCLAAASFLMVHENYLRTRRTLAPTGRTRTLFGGQLQAAAVCVAGAVIAANFLVIPLRAVGSQFRFANALPTIARNLSLIENQVRARMPDNQSVEIATGPARFTGVVLARVGSPKAEYWRGATYNMYTGHGWRNTFADRRTLDHVGDAVGVTAGNAEEFRFNLPVKDVTGPFIHRKRLRQHVTLENGVFNTFYGAGEPRSLVTAEPQILVDDAGTLYYKLSVPSSTYTLDSDVPEISKAELRHLPKDYPLVITDSYLGLPDSTDLQQQLRATASEVTKNATNEYDRVSLLEKWVGSTCKYNTNATAVPTGEDVVGDFLYKQKQGYCDSFAAALTMLCRSIGIPARVASGFLTGDPDTANGEYVVHDRDLHQWTEAYFPQVGWIHFDATGYAQDISNDAQKEQSGGGLMAMLFGRGLLPPIALLTFLLMLVYVVKVEVWDRRRASRARSNPLGLPDSNLAIIAAYQTACRCLSRRGLPRAAAATPREYLDAVRHRMVAAPETLDALERLTALFVRYRYSDAEATSSDVELAQAAAVRLRASLRRIRPAAFAAAASRA